MPRKFVRNSQEHVSGSSIRRRSALKRLENQLLTGFKNIWDEDVMKSEPLTEEDRKRITKEIETLKTRV